MTARGTPPSGSMTARGTPRGLRSEPSAFGYGNSGTPPSGSGSMSFRASTPPLTPSSSRPATAARPATSRLGRTGAAAGMQLCFLVLSAQQHHHVEHLPINYLSVKHGVFESILQSVPMAIQDCLHCCQAPPGCNHVWPCLMVSFHS